MPTEPNHKATELVKYQTGWQKILLCLLWLASPYWLLGGIALLIFMTCDPDSNLYFQSSEILFITMLVPAVCTILLYRHHLAVDSNGIRFPLYLSPFIGFRRKIKWSEIDKIGIEYEDQGIPELGKIILVLNDRQVTINLHCLEEPKRARLLHAIEINSSQVEKAKEFKTTQQLLTGEHRLSGKLATTEGQLLEDKQLSLTYSTPARIVALWTTLLLFPLWGVAGLLGTLALPFVIVLLKLIQFPLVLLAPIILIIGIVATACLFDTTLTVGENGISFPLFMAPFLRFQRERIWSEINRIRYIAKGNALEHGVLDFYFKSGMHIPLSLKALKQGDLEKLLLAINIWGQRIEQDPEIKALQETLSNKKLGHETGTYTKLWEEEMNRRFSSTSFVPLQAGKLLRSGHLKIVKQLAFGGLSAIYLTQKDQTDLLVLKEFVVPELNQQLKSKACEMFEREAALLMKLSHPRLARIHDHFVEDGRTYLLLDYIPGTDLRQIVLQKGALSEDVVVEWAKQLCEVLVYLHKQDPPVVHRDLTPDNILLTASEQIALIDFGAANEFVGTATGTLVGKQSFIAPEQFRGETTLQSDIYSLGATLFYFLTGEEPQSLSQSIPKAIVPEISDYISQLVADCTAYEASERIQSVEEVLERLNGYKAGTLAIKETSYEHQK